VIIDGADDGDRNRSATRVAGLLFGSLKNPLAAREFLRSWNETHCRPPIDDRELSIIINSVAGREADKQIKRRRS
jgi:hypothetical protein